MDQPIIYHRDSFLKAPRHGLFSCLHYAVINDDKDYFLRLIEDPGFEQQRGSFKADYISHYDALEIATAVFNGETKGIINIQDWVNNNMTPLHIAALNNAPRLTKYLLERGDNVDARCDYECMNLKQATPLDFAVRKIQALLKYRYKDLDQVSLYELLWWLCHCNRGRLEVIRLLVQNTENTECVKKAFIDYACKGKLALLRLAALFLAAPELLLSPCSSSPENGLSPLGMLRLGLKSSENRTHIEEELSLLLDVFDMVGDKLVAYVRLHETSDQIIQQTQMEIDFLLREVAGKKQGVSSPDYYFRFFNPGKPQTDQLSSSDLPKKKTVEEMRLLSAEEPGPWMFDLLPPLLMRKDINHAYLYRLLPILESDDADRLNKATKKKLSSMPTLSGCLENMTRVPKKGEKHARQWFPFVSGKSDPSKQSFSTSVASAKPKITPTNSWTDKFMKLSYSALAIPSFSVVAKRFVK